MKSRMVKRCLALLLLMVFIFANIVPVMAESNLRVAKIAKLSGDVKVMKSGGEKSFPAFKNMGLLQGDKLITGTDGSATLEMDGDKEIVVSKSTQLILSELVNALKGTSGSTSLNLLGGKVMVNIKKKLDGDSKFEIKTPTAVMGVRGTFFYVRHEDESTDVAVLHGTVVASYTPTQQEGNQQGREQGSYEVVLQQNQQVTLDQGSPQAGIPPEPEQVTQQNLDLFVLETIRDNPQGVDPNLLQNIDQVIEQRQLQQPPPPPPPAPIPVPPNIIWSNPLLLSQLMQSQQPPVQLPMPPAPLPPAPPSNFNNDRGQNDSQPQIIPVSSITLNSQTLNFTTLQQNAQLTAAVAPSNATNKTVTWSSGNSSIAIVDSTGKVTAKGYGTTTVTASIGSVNAACTVSVTQPQIPVSSITLNNSTLNFTALEQIEQLTAAVAPSNATNKTVVWSSGNSNIAIVDSTGKVTAKGYGTTTVTASIGSVNAACTVSVTQPQIPVSSITLNKSVLSFSTLNDFESLIPTIIPTDATNKCITWESSNPEVATVDQNGKVTATGWGDAVITAAVGSAETTCTVTVAKRVTITSAAFYNIFGDPPIEYTPAVLSAGAFVFDNIVQGLNFDTAGPLGSRLNIMLDTGFDMMDKTLTVDYEKFVNSSSYSVIESGPIIMGSAGTQLSIPLDTGSVGPAGTIVAYRLKNLYVDGKPAAIVNNLITYTVMAKTAQPTAIGTTGEGDKDIYGTAEAGSIIKVYHKDLPEDSWVEFASGAADINSNYYHIYLPVADHPLLQGNYLMVTAQAPGKSVSSGNEFLVTGPLPSGFNNRDYIYLYDYADNQINVCTYSIFNKLYTYETNKAYLKFDPIAAFGNALSISLNGNQVYVDSILACYKLNLSEGLNVLEIEASESPNVNTRTITILIYRDSQELNFGGFKPEKTLATYASLATGEINPSDTYVFDPSTRIGINIAPYGEFSIPYGVLNNSFGESSSMNIIGTMFRSAQNESARPLSDYASVSDTVVDAVYGTGIVEVSPYTWNQDVGFTIGYNMYSTQEEDINKLTTLIGLANGTQAPYAGISASTSVSFNIDGTPFYLSKGYLTDTFKPGSGVQDIASMIRSAMGMDDNTLGQRADVIVEQDGTLTVRTRSECDPDYGEPSVTFSINDGSPGLTDTALLIDAFGLQSSGRSVTNLSTTVEAIQIIENRYVRVPAGANVGNILDSITVDKGKGHAGILCNNDGYVSTVTDRNTPISSYGMYIKAVAEDGTTFRLFELSLAVQEH